MAFKTIHAQRRDYQVRELQEEALFKAIKAESLGPKSLHDLALIQRRRAHLARKRTNWVFTALMATIVVGFVYYVGAPLVQQVNNGVRSAYTAELAIHQDALDEIDETRDQAWAEIISYVKNGNGLEISGDNRFKLRFEKQSYILDVVTETDDVVDQTKIRFKEAFEKFSQITLAPSVTGDNAFNEYLTIPKRVRGSRINRIRFTELTPSQTLDMIFYYAIENSDLPVASASKAIADRAILTAKYDAALQNLNEIRAGGFSLAQRRQDFRLFMETCREGAPETENRSATSEATEFGTTETSNRSSTQTDITSVCVEAYKSLVASEDSEVWEVFAERVPPALLLLFFLATLGPLYRYSLRLTGFHNARADFLEILAQARPLEKWPDDKEGLAELMKLSDILAADKVEFGKSNTPTDQAIELAKTIRGNG